jgi:isopenicillin-N N-acyltransferase-like protein
VHNKCTAFGIAGSADEATYAGQNMDIMSLVEGHQVLLRIQYDNSELESLVFTHAGLIGLCGMNNSPLGVNCNTLMQLGSCSNGLPVAFITRSLLAMSSFDEALLFLNRIRHASGQNYTLSTKGKVGAFECSPQQVVEYRPRSDGRQVVHTNHPLANDDTATYQALAEADPGGPWVRGEGNTRSRLESIATRTLNNDQRLELLDLKSALCARDDPENPVCRDLSVDGSSETKDSANPIAFTAGSMIYEYDEKPLLHLAAGPPGQSEFQVFEFTR